MLTLLAFRRYLVGFAARCTPIALIVVDAGQSTFSAIERVGNVVLGGTIGITFVVIVHGLDELRRRMTALPGGHDGA